jgi:hypothetical protein
VSATVAATGLGMFAPAADALLPDRNVYYAKHCDNPGSAHNGPQVEHASNSNYGNAGYACALNSRSGQVRIWTWNYNPNTRTYSAINSNYGVGAIRTGPSGVGGELIHNEVKLRSGPYNIYSHYLSGVSHYVP